METHSVVLSSLGEYLALTGDGTRYDTERGSVECDGVSVQYVFTLTGVLVIDPGSIDMSQARELVLDALQLVELPAVITYARFDLNQMHEEMPRANPSTSASSRPPQPPVSANY